MKLCKKSEEITHMQIISKQDWMTPQGTIQRYRQDRMNLLPSFLQATRVLIMSTQFCEVRSLHRSATAHTCAHTLPSPLVIQVAMTSAHERLASLRKKKVECKQTNAAILAREQKRERASANHSIADEEEKYDSEEDDRLNWTAAQWEAWELKQGRQETAGGYKNLTDLAFSTYKKATSKQVVDKEKYQAHLARDANTALVEGEDVEKLARTLQEASDARLKRRRKEQNAGSYITEKNRQFNMKLEREYGSD